MAQALDPDGGATLTVDESKLTIPRRRDGLVVRSALIDRLRREEQARVVRITAPAGYGKTTLLAQWASADARPFAWLALDRHDNDPVVFLTHLAIAIHRATPIDAGVFATLGSAGTSVWSSTVPRLGAALASAPESIVVVLDDDHELVAQECADALGALVRHLPPGSLLVLSGRGDGAVPLARVRVSRELLELGRDQLALGDEDARALFENAHVRMSERDAQRLNARAEGWAAGLYLAALALRDQGPAAAAEFGGDDRFVADYLRNEHLGSVPPERLRFLTRTSVLERMSGPLCDAVLGRSDSGAELESLARSNLFVVPLDRTERWLRYHHLFRDLLRAELERSAPDEVPGLHRRAAAWYAANGSPEAAIEHALAAGDVDDAARLIVDRIFPVLRESRYVTLERWLEALEDAGALERNPALAGLGTWVHSLRGRRADAERLAAYVERADAGGPLPAGSADVRGWGATGRALLCRRGVDAMHVDAALAVRETSEGSLVRGFARMLLGVATLLRGDPESAERTFEDAVGEATAAGGTFSLIVAQSECALLALDRGDLERTAEALAAAAAIVDDEVLPEYVSGCLLLAARARLATRRGERDRAREDLRLAQRLRPLIPAALPWYAVLTRLELARAHVDLGDVDGARTLLGEARRTLATSPPLGALAQWADDLRDQLGAMAARSDPWASTMTAAELRLLPLLTTHLTFQEIGTRLFVSRNTIKTQAISIYRKLGASSRSDAIARAAELGLVDAAVLKTAR